MSGLSQLARKYNCAAGQLSMARGCVHCVLYLTPKLSKKTIEYLSGILAALDIAREEVKKDYQLNKTSYLETKKLLEVADGRSSSVS